MPRTTRTYDEIVRRTVVEPDLSFQPTPEQMAEGPIGERAMFADERALFERVRDELLSRGFVMDTFSIEVVGTKVVLRGHVRDAACMRAIEHAVSTVEGVETFEDHLVAGDPKQP